MTSIPVAHQRAARTIGGNSISGEKEIANHAHQLADICFKEHCQRVWRRTDRLFVALMIFQWLAGIAVAIWITPLTWIGATPFINLHVPMAVILGGLIAILPIGMVYCYPGRSLTRQVVAVSQMLASSLLIHLSGGRIETHFHIFGSLAFLAFYRDWRVLITATTVVGIDHLMRGMYWSESVFGTFTPGPFRWLEHVGWVLFEDLFLFIKCHQSVGEMRHIAQRQAELEMTNDRVELVIAQRTAELTKSNEELQSEISERKKAEAERQMLGIQLQQAQKLESIGQLAAGIAHEINTPTQYVSDNTRFLESSFRDLNDVLERQHALLDSVKSNKTDLREEVASVEEAIDVADLDYLRDEIPKAISQSLKGLESITKIVRSMKDFSHPSDNTKSMVDLNRSIQSTMDVCRNEWKYKAEMVLRFDSELPPVYCLQDEINQVVLNIIVNAAHAIEDVVGKNTGKKGTISISTKKDGDMVELRICDTGTGIPESALNRIFDPFFTTKPVGKGTGQGLAIAYAIITQKHQGTIAVETEMGIGTTFIIRLPIITP